MGETGRTIVEAVVRWAGVEAHPHRFGGIEFTVDHREIGHLHGDRLADLPFPKRIRDELVASGRAGPHHVLPDTGWVSKWIRGPEDIPEVVALFRLSYERLSTIGKTPTKAP
ncbi:MAG: hypothetical protein AUH31_01235 [Armatimonadetes bacterium 13_1_40CM_64_14]|nr:MAG: hypothetical protein AUH31_01235 [Armatimonadetes bacterium 13_1_40CM_64_14]